jgi:hypothetical protein
MTQYVVLRHQFDIHRNPDRLGPVSDYKFCLTMNPGGAPPSWLAGNLVWLVSWEGFMKAHHVIVGYFEVSTVERRHGVVANYAACGDTGVLFPQPLGPLDIHAWFHKFVEANRSFRDGAPTDLGESADELLALTRGAGYAGPQIPTPTV